MSIDEEYHQMMRELAGKVMYRYEEEHHWDVWNGEYTHTTVKLYKFPVIRCTPCGVWIRVPFMPGRRAGPKRWISTNPSTRKAWARDTPKRALKDLVRRKESLSWGKSPSVLWKNTGGT